jgi:hypothetical protein
MEVLSVRTLLVLLAIVISSCAGTNQNRQLNEPLSSDRSLVRFNGGDGSDCKNRIIITGAPNEPTGIKAERFWLNEHYPGAKKIRQELFKCDGKPVDWITIQTADGKIRDVVFDINEFVGK